MEVLTGWGRSSRSVAHVADPATDEDILKLVHASADCPLLARGAGRSYGDAAGNRDGCVIRTLKLTAIHSFDAETGLIVVDPGVTFGQLLHRFAPQGWIPPVTPGTQFATIGGAIANDVHGKNHDADGSFGDHVRWFDMVLPDGTPQRIDPVSTPELFAATVGGVGLTGIITRACFGMKRVLGTRLLVQKRRIACLDDYLEALSEARSLYRYSVGWIDGVAAGRNLGRGIFETAEHADDPGTLEPRRRIRMPIDLPSRTINSLTVGLFNRLYYRRIPASGTTQLLDMETFFYPLDAILEWNRIYGRAGFVQFQCVVPDTEARVALRTLLTRIAASGRASFLAVIKTLGRPGLGYLSFPERGITLALDFPRSPGIERLLTSLHDITLAHGGRVYLAKDSCLTPAQFHRMYPQIPALREVLERVDPSRRMRSDMSIRLQL